MPYQSVNGQGSAGAVHVVYGCASGVCTSLHDYWTQDSLLEDRAEAGDHFGMALASGDFDNDGYGDLAIGVPGENVVRNGVERANAGAVNVLYGGPGGLTFVGDQLWTQGPLDGTIEQGDSFGDELAVGDFDRDGFDDLAIGVSREGVNGDADAGAVNVIYGGPSGLAQAGNQLWHQDDSIYNEAEPGDRWGFSLAVGDFNGDLAEDLAVGAPGEDIGGASDAGMVNVLYGSPGQGLTDVGDQRFHEDRIAGVSPEDFDGFGAELASGDFDGDSFDDLVVTVLLQDVGTADDAGAVHVLYGGPQKLTTAGHQHWTQDSPGVNTNPGHGETFGYSLAAGDFDGDNRTDLAIGVPGQGIAGEGSAGAVYVLHGDSNGLTTGGDQLWHQDSTFVADVAEQNDRYGRSLACADFTGDGIDELAIGVPYEHLTPGADVGAVNILFGSGSGLSALWNQWIAEDEFLPPVAGSRFGFTLMTGDGIWFEIPQ